MSNAAIRLCPAACILLNVILQAPDGFEEVGYIMVLRDTSYVIYGSDAYHEIDKVRPFGW